LFFMRMVDAPYTGNLEADDTGHDQGDRDHAHGRGRIAEHHDAQREGADRADAGPHRVGRAHGDEALCPQKQRAAGRHGDDGEQDPQRAGTLVGPAELQPDRPADLANSRQYKIKPSHSSSPSSATAPSLTTAYRPVLIETCTHLAG
jgi:hypothetical protein